MPAYENARLVLKGMWGDNRRMFKVADASRKALEKAQKRGDMQNLIVIGDKAGDEAAGKALPVALSFRLQFPEAYNVKAKWTTADVAALPYFDDYSHPTGFDGAGLGYVKTGDSSAYFTTTAMGGGGFPQLRNGPFAVRVNLPETESFAVFTLALWGGTTSQWQLELIDGSLYIMRLSEAWNQSDEDALHALMAIENPTTGDTAAADTLISALYKDYTHLSGFGSKNDWYGRTRVIAVIAEPRGIVWLWDGARWGKARHSDILKTRLPGTLWSDSRLTVGTTGPSFFWQIGYPQFALSGELRYPQYPTPLWMDEFSPVVYNTVDSRGNTLTGTSINYANNVSIGKSYFSMTLATSNSRYTPFSYDFAAYIPADERTGVTEELWNSDNPAYADAQGNSPILDVQPQVEGEHLARTYIVLVRDVGGSVLEDLSTVIYPAIPYDSGAWHVCDYYEGGVKLISNGFVRRAEFGDMRNTEYNQVRAEVAHQSSIVTLEVCDQWAVLDNYATVEQPIGDGLRVSDHIRQILNLPGIPAGEYAGVPTATGRLCGAAVPGEDWKTRPAKGASAGDYLRNYVQRKGNGRVLRNEPGGWVFGYRSTAVFSIGGSPANFTSDAASNDPSSYPGRWAIIRRLKLVFDWNEYYNEFVVVGAEDEDGNQVTQVARINRAINPTSATAPRIYTGIPRRLYTECPDSVTASEVALDRRSLQLEYALPPRWNAFETYYHRGLCPGWRITADGTPARVYRVSDGSWHEDKMLIIYRELES